MVVDDEGDFFVNIEQIERRGLAPMHTDHSRVAAGESPQSQFSELIRNMLGSGPSALTNVNFEMPELKVELQQKEELKEQVHSLEDEQLQQEVEEEETEEEASTEVEVTEEQVVTEELVVAKEIVQEQVQIFERTDRSIKSAEKAEIVIDKSTQADVAREVVQQSAVTQAELQAQVSDGEQGGYKGQTAAEKVNSMRNLRDEAQAVRFADDARQELVADEEVRAPMMVAPTVDTNSATKPATPATVASHVAVIATQTAESAIADKGNSHQAAAISGTNGAREEIAQTKKGEKADPQRKTQTNEMVEKIRDLIAQANQSKDSNTISVRISPEGLGAMVVKVTQKDDQTYARIIPESPETETLLRGKIQEIAQTLQASGMKIDNVHISIGQDQSQADFFNFSQFSSGLGAQTNGENSGSANAERELARQKVLTPNADALQAQAKLARTLEQGWVA